jgi:hypothetical protein
VIAAELEGVAAFDKAEALIDQPLELDGARRSGKPPARGSVLASRLHAILKAALPTG